MAVTQVRTKQQILVSADLDFKTFKGINLVDPTNPQDAATKAYVDAARTGIDAKASVRAASTANVTVTYNATAGTSTRGQITAAPNTLDGLTLAANDRILLKDQSTGAQNGIWVVTTLGTGANGVWDRATDFDSDAEVTSGPYVWVEEGTLQSDSAWVMTNNSPIIIGGASGTALTWVLFSSAGQLIAGDGLTKTGNSINAVGTSNRITVSADAIDIASTYVGQTSITTLGTVTTGTWNATAVGAIYGGTGFTTYTTGDLIYASASNTLSKLAIGGSNQVLTIVGGVPTWQNAATGFVNPMTTIGDIIYGSTGGAAVRLAGNNTTTPQFLVSTGSGSAATAPAWVSSTGSGNVVLATSPTITGGAHTALTSLGIRDTSAAFDVTIAATSSTALTAGRTLTIDMVNAARTLKLAGNLDIAGNVIHAGAFSVTMTATAATTVTLPTTGTLLSTTSYVVRETPSGTANGSTTSFGLAATPISGTEQVYVNGVLQNAGGTNDYQMSGQNVVFNTSPDARPQSGDVILVTYLK